MATRRSGIKLLRRIGQIACLSVLLIVLVVAAFLARMALYSEPATFDQEAAKGISCEPWKQLVPGAAVPVGLHVMSSNNNLDIVQLKGTYFFAFRTAPTHFASVKTRLVVLRSPDRSAWQLDGEFEMGSDLREPRFLVFKDTLFLYFFQGGKSMFSFAPESIYVAARDGEGKWSAPKTVFRPGYVVWRAKVLGDKAYMSVYNGAGLYTTADRKGDLRLLTSVDGYTWEPVSDVPQVDAVSAEEGEFEFDADGNLFATVRLETGGGMVCRAAKDDLSKWQCVYTPYKYDSALMFRHGSAFYVLARRNIAGAFASGGEWLPKAWQRGWRLARYSLTRKRTTLYKLDTENLKLAPLFDLPSKGDTAYAGIVPLDPDSYWIANYSSRLDGPDWPWLAGQLTGTNIYDTVLRFPSSPK
jgi:hypothetical protein